MPSVLKNPYQPDRNKYTKSYLATAQGNNFNRSAENMTKSEQLMGGVKLWTSYWRKRPDKFAEEVYGIKLKNFQKALLCLMMRDTYFMFLAARGLRQDFSSCIILYD